MILNSSNYPSLYKKISSDGPCFVSRAAQLVERERKKKQRKDKEAPEDVSSNPSSYDHTVANLASFSQSSLLLPFVFLHHREAVCGRQKSALGGLPFCSQLSLCISSSACPLGARSFFSPAVWPECLDAQSTPTEQITRMRVSIGDFRSCSLAPSAPSSGHLSARKRECTSIFHFGSEPWPPALVLVPECSRELDNKRDWSGICLIYFNPRTITLK